MLLYFAVAALQFTALAAFLILWHFWVKRKIDDLCFPDEADQALLPFRRFCRLLLGVVFLTWVTQIYFLWASSAFHEEMASVAGVEKKQEQNIRAIDELKGLIEGLRKETASNSRLLHAGRFERGAEVKGRETSDNLRVPAGGFLESEARPSPQLGSADIERGGFAEEAKASSVTSIRGTLERERKAGSGATDKIYSMPLNRQGRVLTEKLRVRKRPQQDSEIVEKLLAGQHVKVTEKRLVNDTMWFRIVTPSGRAGWVDFRYLRLDVGA